jgi:hypothetical protein
MPYPRIFGETNSQGDVGQSRQRHLPLHRRARQERLQDLDPDRHDRSARHTVLNIAQRAVPSDAGRGPGDRLPAQSRNHIRPAGVQPHEAHRRLRRAALRLRQPRQRRSRSSRVGQRQCPAGGKTVAGEAGAVVGAVGDIVRDRGAGGTTTISGGSVTTSGRAPSALALVDTMRTGAVAVSGGSVSLTGTEITTSANGSAGLVVNGAGSSIMATGITVTTQGGVDPRPPRLKKRPPATRRA